MFNLNIEYMIGKLIKDFFKDEVYVVHGYGMVMSYKVNVNVNVKNVYGADYTYIDLNIKIIDCFRILGCTPVFGGGKRIKMTYDDVRSVVRKDLNNRFCPMFSRYLFKGTSTLLTSDSEIKINRFTYC